jgi:hypothetical protein
MSRDWRASPITSSLNQKTSQALEEPRSDSAPPPCNRLQGDQARGVASAPGSAGLKHCSARGRGSRSARDPVSQPSPTSCTSSLNPLKGRSAILYNRWPASLAASIRFPLPCRCPAINAPRQRPLFHFRRRQQRRTGQATATSASGCSRNRWPNRFAAPTEPDRRSVTLRRNVRPTPPA